MDKILSQNDDSITYLRVINRKQYQVVVSKNGELLDISPYQKETSEISFSSARKNIEFG